MAATAQRRFHLLSSSAPSIPARSFVVAVTHVSQQMTLQLTAVCPNTAHGRHSTKTFSSAVISCAKHSREVICRCSHSCLAADDAAIDGSVSKYCAWPPQHKDVFICCHLVRQAFPRGHLSLQSLMSRSR